MPTTDAPPETLQRQLGWWDVTAITAGIIIGSGIYRLPPDIAKHLGSAWEVTAIWVAGGCIALIGALCYAELAAAYPLQGGTYVYLNKAFGRLFGFLYVWAEFWIVRPGNIAVMAFIFAEYAAHLVPALRSDGETRPLAELYVAGGAVFVLGLMNLLGVRAGKAIQMVLTVSKVAGLLAIFAVGMFAAPSEAVVTITAAAPAESNWLLALVFVMFAYGGWNETAAVAAEVREPQRNLLRGLLLGTGIVVLSYVLVNLALLRVLGFDGIAQGEAVAATLMERGMGPRGAQAISALVCISCLGAINGMLFTGARLYYALGREQPAFAWLGHWNQRLGTPVRALGLQTAVAIALLGVFGLYKNAFEQLVFFTVPLFWTFLLLVSIAVVVLRLRDPATPRPFRLPLFPLEPAIFCLASLLMIYKGVMWLGLQPREAPFYFSAGSMVAVMLAGGLVFLLTRRPTKRAKL